MHYNSSIIQSGKIGILLAAIPKMYMPIAEFSRGLPATLTHQPQSMPKGIVGKWENPTKIPMH